MQAEKCPSPYVRGCVVISHQVYQAGCEWLASGTFPPHLNSTNIVLIPKGNTQTSMKD